MREGMTPGPPEHGPAPTLWPLGFAVGIAVALVGLIVDPTVIASIGAAIAIVFGFLWARDATTEMRRHAPMGPAAVREATPAGVASPPAAAQAEAANGPTGAILGEKNVTEHTVNGSILLRPVVPAGFGCPCHGGQYDTEGNRTAGPPVRALDRYQFEIKNGHLLLLSTFSVSHVVGT